MGITRGLPNTLAEALEALRPGPNTGQMVAALGGYGERVEDLEEIRPALERARDSGVPACVNVSLDPKLTG